MLQREQNRIQQVIDSYPHRLLSTFGGIAMAAGLTTYLGPYHHNIRRIMLTIHWPNCLRERGIPLVIDSIDELKGKTELLASITNNMITDRLVYSFLLP